jgi:hypothetical protein
MIFDSTPNAGGLYYFPGCGLKPRYPSLWNDCVFASGPLGNEGFRLCDFTGRTPGATWSVGAGDVPKYTRGSVRGQAFFAGQYDGSNDSARCTGLADLTFPRSFGGWFRVSAHTNFARLMVVAGTDGISTSIALGDLRASAVSDLAVAGETTAQQFFPGSLNEWFFLLTTWTSEASVIIRLNGNVVTPSSAPSTLIQGNVPDAALSLGARWDQSFAQVQIAATCVYRRILTPAEIATLALNPLEAYRVEVPRYYDFPSSPTTAPWLWAARRNSMIGSGLGV